MYTHAQVCFTTYINIHRVIYVAWGLKARRWPKSRDIRNTCVPTLEHTTQPHQCPYSLLGDPFLLHPPVCSEVTTAEGEFRASPFCSHSGMWPKLIDGVVSAFAKFYLNGIALCLPLRFLLCWRVRLRSFAFTALLHSGAWTDCSSPICSPVAGPCSCGVRLMVVVLYLETLHSFQGWDWYVISCLSSCLVLLSRLWSHRMNYWVFLFFSMCWKSFLKTGTIYTLNVFCAHL